MTDIRLATNDDLDAVYGICLQSADQGHDASHLYDDPKMVGHIYAAPYLALCAETSLVAVDGNTIVGYLVGTPDTAGYERKLESDWWPDLRAIHAEPDLSLQAQWSADQARAHFFHHPVKTPPVILADYPAHMHMNLLPQGRGQGIGPRLLESWLEVIAKAHRGESDSCDRLYLFVFACLFRKTAAHFCATRNRYGVAGVHVGSDPHNPGALRFWSGNGFAPLNDRLGLPSDRTLWLGRSL